MEAKKEVKYYKPQLYRRVREPVEYRVKAIKAYDRYTELLKEGMVEGEVIKKIKEEFGYKTDKSVTQMMGEMKVRDLKIKMNRWG